MTQDRFDPDRREIRILICQGKQSITEILVDQGVSFFIVVDMHTKAATVCKVSFELSKQAGGNELGHVFDDERLPSVTEWR